MYFQCPPPLPPPESSENRSGGHLLCCCRMVLVHGACLMREQGECLKALGAVGQSVSSAAQLLTLPPFLSKGNPRASWKSSRKVSPGKSQSHWMLMVHALNRVSGNCVVSDPVIGPGSKRRGFVPGLMSSSYGYLGHVLGSSREQWLAWAGEVSWGKGELR